MKSRINRTEAKYAAYHWAYSWVSEAAEQHYDSDFYNELRSAAMLDKTKLDETNGFDNIKQIFVPNDAEVKLIKSEMVKLSDKLFNEMIKCKNRYDASSKIKKNNNTNE